MPKFKGVKIIAILCLVAFLFCGCNSFRLSSSIDDLISPISPSGDNAPAPVSTAPGLPWAKSSADQAAAE